MTKAVEILQEDPSPRQLDNFYGHLIKNKNDLMVSRNESGFKTFLKGLGVAGATIFGLGIGGYFAYRELFIQSRGKNFINEINQTYNTLKKSG